MVVGDHAKLRCTTWGPELGEELHVGAVVLRPLVWTVVGVVRDGGARTVELAGGGTVRASLVVNEPVSVPPSTSFTLSRLNTTAAEAGVAIATRR